MREILFRGKCLADGEWIYGYYTGPVGIDPSHEICDIADPCGSRIDVDPDTVGQYTGLTDKNGTKIFEGDVVDIGEHDLMVNGLYCVIFCMANHCWALQRGCEHRESYFSFSDLNGFAESSVVVGNIHDNPELMKGGAPDGI